MGRVKGLAWSLVVAPLSVLSFPIYPLLLRMEATPLNPGAWSRLRAICGLSPLLHSPGEGGGGRPGYPQLQSRGWRARCRQLHYETPPKSGGNFLRGGVVQTGTICAWPICAPIESLVSCLTNSLGLLIPLLHHSPPWPGHSASHGQWGGSPKVHALARGLRDKPLRPPSPKSWTQNWQPPAPIPCARIQFNSVNIHEVPRWSQPGGGPSFQPLAGTGGRRLTARVPTPSAGTGRLLYADRRAAVPRVWALPPRSFAVLPPPRSPPGSLTPPRGALRSACSQHISPRSLGQGWPLHFQVCGS